MSRLSEKIEQVTARGKASRATWTPEIGSAPLRVYRWWRRYSGKQVKQENFCHFWRVVLIWAPLLAVRRWFRNYGEVVYIITMVLMVLTFVAGIQWEYIGAWALLAAPAEIAGLILILVAGVLIQEFFFERGAWSLRYRLSDRRCRRLNETVKKEPTPPSATKEFVVLIGQVIRVKKWKICPLVEIPPQP